MPIQKITREEILQKSLEVIQRQGYYRTSMNDLAEACKLQKGSFYHYFQSKEALMKELLEYMREMLKEKAFSLAYNNDLTAWERLSKMLITQSKILLANDGSCIFGNTTLEAAHHNAEFTEILRGVFDDWTQAMHHIFKMQYPDETALRFAQQALMEFQGAVMMSYLYKNSQLLRDTYTRTMAKLKQ